MFAVALKQVAQWLNVLTCLADASRSEKNGDPRGGRVSELHCRRLPCFRRISAWLACGEPPAESDLIFVLAGRLSRKTYGLKLFKQGKAPRILLSVGRFEIRRFERLDLPARINLLELASRTAPPQRHYFVEFEGREFLVEQIRVSHFGTLAELKALRDWLRKRPYVNSLQIISSWGHLRRVRMCCRALLPGELQVRFVPVPGAEVRMSVERWANEKDGSRQLLLELVKILLYRLVLWLRLSFRER